MDIINAILEIDPKARSTCIENDFDRLTWQDGNPNKITVDQIKVKQAEMQKAYDDAKYQRDRKSAYPSIADQLDDLYHNGIDGWKATIKAVKDKYPKG